MKIISLAALLAAACSNGPAPVVDLGVADAAVDQASPPDLTPLVSEFKVTGKLFSLDTGNYVKGIGSTFVGLPSFTGTPSDANGLFELPIPTALCGGPAPRLVFEGQPTGTGDPKLIKTEIVIQPPPMLTCKASPYLGFVHVHSEGGIRDAIARELAMHGDIPMADGASGQAFAASWSWATVRTIKMLAGGDETFYRDGAVELSGDGGQCKRIYNVGYGSFRSGTSATFLDFSATRSGAGFVVVCPRAFTAPVTITGSGFFDGNGFPATLPSFSLQLSPDVANSVDWGP